MQRLRFVTARDLFAAFPPAVKDVGVPATEEGPLDYMNRLAASGQLLSAVSFCAYLLERRQATDWTYHAMGALLKNPTPAEERAFATTAAWIQLPDEPHRRDAYEAALLGDHTSPATFTAYAAAFAGPSLRPSLQGQDSGVVIKIPTYLTAQSARTAFLLAVSRLPAKEKEEFLGRALNEGIQLAIAT